MTRGYGLLMSRRSRKCSAYEREEGLIAPHIASRRQGKGLSGSAGYSIRSKRGIYIKINRSHRPSERWGLLSEPSTVSLAAATSGCHTVAEYRESLGSSNAVSALSGDTTLYSPVE